MAVAFKFQLVLDILSGQFKLLYMIINTCIMVSLITIKRPICVYVFAHLDFFLQISVSF